MSCVYPLGLCRVTHRGYALFIVSGSTFEKSTIITMYPSHFGQFVSPSQHGYSVLPSPILAPHLNTQLNSATTSMIPFTNSLSVNSFPPPLVPVRSYPGSVVAPGQHPAVLMPPFHTSPGTKSMNYKISVHMSKSQELTHSNPTKKRKVIDMNSSSSAKVDSATKQSIEQLQNKMEQVVQGMKDKDAQLQQQQTQIRNLTNELQEQKFKNPALSKEHSSSSTSTSTSTSTTVSAQTQTDFDSQNSHKSLEDKIQLLQQKLTAVTATLNQTKVAHNLEIQQMQKNFDREKNKWKQRWKLLNLYRQQIVCNSLKLKSDVQRLHTQNRMQNTSRQKKTR